MAQGFVINALLNASRFLRGVKDMDDALDDLEGALEDAQDEVDRLDRDGEKAFENVADATDDAADEANTLEKRLRDVRDAAKDAGKAGDDAGDDIRSGFKRAEGGLSEFKDEANSTAREAAASFDGSAESIGDAFQEVAANAFSGFGPAGAVAGIAAAAGIGLAVAGFEAVSEAQAASEEAIAEWADAFIEAGDKVLSAGITAAKFQEIITDPEKFKEAQKNAEDWGVSIETAVAAMSGNAGAIDDVRASVDRLGDAYEEAREKAPPIDEFGNVNGVLLEQEQAYLRAAGSLSKLTGEMEAGQQRADLLNRYYEDLINSAEGATKEVDELGNAVYTLPDGTTIFVDAETKQATQNVDKFKGDVDGIPEVVNTTVRIGVDDRAWRAWVPGVKTGQVNARFGRWVV